jgi:hypothetical protein
MVLDDTVSYTYLSISPPTLYNQYYGDETLSRAYAA